jgi:hypothetical protein
MSPRVILLCPTASRAAPLSVMVSAIVCGVKQAMAHARMAMIL